MGLSLSEIKGSKLGTRGFERYGVKFTKFEQRGRGMYGKVEGTERWQHIYPYELLRYTELLMKVLWESRLEYVVTGNTTANKRVKRYTGLLEKVEEVVGKKDKKEVGAVCNKEEVTYRGN